MTPSRPIVFHPADRPGSPFSRAVEVGGILYLSGQIGNRRDGGFPDGIEAQARQTMDNIAAVLGSLGASMADVFKMTIMLADMGEWRGFNRAYLDYFDPARLPARSAFGASGLVGGALVEVECCAIAPVADPAPST